MSGNPKAKGAEVPEGEGWNERESAELFRFESIGDSVQGRLLSREETYIEGKPVWRYEFLTKDGPVAILGTTDINRKMHGVLNGTEVYISYRADVDTGQTYAMREFHVLTRPIQRKA